MNAFSHAQSARKAIQTMLHLALISMTLLMSSATAQTQSWTLQNDQAIEGEIQMVRNSRVELQLKNGRRIGLDIMGFSKPSQAKIHQWIKTQGGSAAYASWIKSPDSAFLKSWPTTIHGPYSPVVKRILKDSRPHHYVFESDHYRFISDKQLSPLLIQKFATLFETTYQYNMELPLNIPARYREKNHKFVIYLIEKYETYLSLGGPVDSAGCYVGRQQHILVQMTSLGAYRKGSKWAYKKGAENMVIVHEITHQLMEGILSSPWYIEGSAEYIAATRYTHASFHVHGSKSHVFTYVTSKKPSNAHFSRRLGSRVSMPSLKRFMNMSYAEFSKKDDSNRNYGIALLLTYYFYHADGSGNAHNIKSYIKALQRGKSNSQALELLLNGRSYKTLQKSFRSYCAQNGLAIDFK